MKADPVLIVSRSSPVDFNVLAAQLPPKELNAVGATVLKTLLESGADLEDTLRLLYSLQVVDKRTDAPMPIVLGGNLG